MSTSRGFFLILLSHLPRKTLVLSNWRSLFSKQHELDRFDFLGGKVVLGLVALSGLQMFLTIAPQLIITPAALFGAIKLTKNKTKLEKTISVTVAVVGSFIACSLFTKTPVPSGSFSSSYSSNNITTDSGETITREELRQARIACKELIKASGSNDTEQCWKYSNQ